MSDNDDDRVAYKRPPKHSRFQAGQSGNPSGRPKNAGNWMTDLAKALSTIISIRESGRVRRVSKQQAFFEAMVNAAIAGDRDFARMLIPLCISVSVHQLEEDKKKSYAVANSENHLALREKLLKLIRYEIEARIAKGEVPKPENSNTVDKNELATTNLYTCTH